jgi:O-antigen ligase
MLIFGMFFSAVVATILVFFPVVAEVINEFTFEKTESYSFNERTGGMLDALILFSERPFLGWGWGRSTSHSVVTILLANVGLIGSLLFIGLVVCSLWGAYACSRSRLSTREVSDQIDAARLTVIISLTASVISGLKYVVLDTWFWWGLLIALESAARRKQSPGRREAADSA